jgi:hypothetical protein
MSLSGPFTTKEAGGYYTVIGVVSWGFGCADVRHLCRAILLRPSCLRLGLHVSMLGLSAVKGSAITQLIINIFSYLLQENCITECVKNDRSCHPLTGTLSTFREEGLGGEHKDCFLASSSVASIYLW